MMSLKKITREDAGRILEIIEGLKEGETVYFEPGFYMFDDVNNIFIQKSINLVGAGSSPDDVVLNGLGEGSTVMIEGDDVCVNISNLTISGGNFKYGGGVRIEYAKEVNIRNCKIVKNRARDYGGGGLFCGGGNLIISQTVFSENTSGFYGGAILIEGGCDVLIKDSLIVKNRAEHGDAITIKEGSRVEILRTTIADNENTGIYVVGSETSKPKLLISGSIIDEENAVLNDEVFGGSVHIKESVIHGRCNDFIDEGGNKRDDPLLIREQNLYVPAKNSPALGMIDGYNKFDLLGRHRLKKGTAGALEVR